MLLLLLLVRVCFQLVSDLVFFSAHVEKNNLPAIFNRLSARNFLPGIVYVLSSVGTGAVVC